RRLDLNRKAAEGVGARLELLARTEWSNAWQESMVAVAGRVVAAVNASNEVCLRVARGADLSVSPAASSSKLLRLGKLLPDAHCVDLRFAFSSTLQRIQAAVQEAATLLKDYKSCEQ